jgi:hypothetical protein
LVSSNACAVAGGNNATFREKAEFGDLEYLMAVILYKYAILHLAVLEQTRRFASILF